MTSRTPAHRRFRIGGPRVRAALVGAAMVGGLMAVNSGTSFAVQFCNTTPITSAFAAGPGSPYPSNIVVSGLTGTVTDVNVILLDVRTTGDNNSPPQHWVEDADVMVSAPNPATNVILMSDAGGNNDTSAGPVVDADLTFDDQASNQLPADTGPLVSGTYRPVDDDNDVGAQPGFETDVWAGAAPAPTSSTALSTFNGTDPNGTWSLWLVDDQTQATVNINGGWCVDIFTTGGGTTTSSTGATTTSSTMATTTSSTMATTTSSTMATTTSSTIPPTVTCGAPPAATIQAQPGVVTFGTAGNDVIYGTAGNDRILGGGGNDIIVGLGGDDQIAGGDGNDVLCGGAGNDQLSGDGGNDQLVGDAGNDVLSGGSGDDHLVGGLGVDRLSGASGVDQCVAGGQAGDFSNPPPDCDTIA
jgi:Ca2+-binding RTX toxin-like protein